jgi:hypothetical protein
MGKREGPEQVVPPWSGKRKLCCPCPYISTPGMCHKHRRNAAHHVSGDRSFAESLDPTNDGIEVAPPVVQ